MKLKHLLPISIIAGMTAAIPSIVACSPAEKDDAILINVKYTIQGKTEPTLLTNGTKIAFTKGQSFDIKFYWKDANSVGAIDGQNGWCLAVGLYDPDVRTVKLNQNSVSIKVNGTPLLESEYEVAEFDIEPASKWDLNDESYIEISFALSSEEAPAVDKGYLFVNSDTK